MIKIYVQKKEDTIKAIQWTGDNTNEVIDFGSYKVDNCLYKDIELPPEDIQEKLKQPELWISNWCGGDVVYVGDYVAALGDYVKIPQKEFEDHWVIDKDFNYKSKSKKQVEAIQWKDNTEEVKIFVGDRGNTDATGQTFILMNSLGGSVVMPGDFIVKFGGEFYGVGEKDFTKEYKEV